MRHPDLKPLVWGRHLQQLLGGCRIATPREPLPRMAQPMPLWFRRAAAALTLFGLIGLIRAVDATITDAVAPNSAGLREPVPFDPLTWNDWASRLGFGLATQVILKEATPESDASPIAWRSGQPLAARQALNVSGMGVSGVGVDGMDQRRSERRGHGFRFQLIQVTAYTSCGTETDDSPHVTSSGKKTVAGTIALSRDLLREFTPGAPFAYGDKVLIPGVGVFEAHDTMHSKWKRKADIWFPTKEQARAWGRRTVFVTKVSSDAPLMAHLVRGS